MTPAEIEAIAGGYHGDAFRILGPHAVKPKENEPRWEVRAFLPQAESVSVVSNGCVTPMKQKHRDGFFAALLMGETRPYRFQIETWDKKSEELEDPYRFPPLLTDYDIHLHGEGTHYESYNTLGAHLATVEAVAAVRFAVWAPNAEGVSVAGDFNQWDTRRHPMRKRNGGIWELFLPNLGEGAAYKYHVRSQFQGYQQLKADPYGFGSEVPPKSASVVRHLDAYEWNDAEWMAERAGKDYLREPVSIYEVH